MARKVKKTNSFDGGHKKKEKAILKKKVSFHMFCFLLWVCFCFF